MDLLHTDLEKLTDEEKRLLCQSFDSAIGKLLLDSEYFSKVIVNNSILLSMVEVFLISLIENSKNDFQAAEGECLYQYLNLYVKDKVAKNPLFYYENPVIQALYSNDSSKIEAVIGEKLANLMDEIDIDHYLDHISKVYRLIIEKKVKINSQRLMGIITSSKGLNPRISENGGALYVFSQIPHNSIKLEPSDLEMLYLSFFHEELNKLGFGDFSCSFVPDSKLRKIKDSSNVANLTCGVMQFDAKKVLLNRDLYLCKTFSGSVKSFQTFGHEVCHIRQHINFSSITNQFSNLCLIKERLMRDVIDEEFYEENYDFLRSEADAEIEGYLFYKKVLEVIFPDLLRVFSNDIDEKISLNRQRMRNPFLRADGKHYTCDVLFDMVVRLGPSMLEEYPELQKEYSSSGRRYTTLELLEIKQVLMEQLTEQMDPKTHQLKAQEIYFYQDLIYNRNLSLREIQADLVDLSTCFDERLLPDISSLFQNYYPRQLLDLKLLASLNDDPKMMEKITSTTMYFEQNKPDLQGSVLPIHL